MRRCFIEMRNRIILQKIIGYCRRIESNLKRFDYDYPTFETDHLFHDACCMCVVQIGELAASFLMQ